MKTKNHYLHAVKGQGVWRLKSEKPIVTLEDLRSLIAVHVHTRRPALVAELKRLGTDKISTLNKEHYTTFYKFMQNLK